MRRRSFLTTASVVAITAVSGSWRVAIGQSSLTEHQSISLLRMVRDIFPHDVLSDEPYEAIVAQLRVAAADADTFALLKSGIKDLDEAVGGVWASQDEKERVEALAAIEMTPFFITVRVAALFGLYANSSVWPALGYEGESYSQGGYLFRGFDDLDWLAEPLS